MNRPAEKKHSAFNFSIMAVIGMVLFLAVKGRQSPTPELNREEVEIENAGMTTELTRSLSLPAMSVSQAQREKLKEFEEHPDDFYDPNNKNPEYLKKVAHHHRIGSFVESPYRDDPGMREILSYLLANGYGIENWGATVSFLYGETFMVRTALKIMREKGMSEKEIEEALTDPNPKPGSPLWMKAEKGKDDSFQFRKLALTTGIDDPDVLEGLLERESVFYEFGFSELITGDTVATAEKGDRLYTDRDWLEPEFVDAMNAFEGEPRPSRQESNRRILGLGEPDVVKNVVDEQGSVVRKELWFSK